MRPSHPQFIPMSFITYKDAAPGFLHRPSSESDQLAAADCRVGLAPWVYLFLQPMDTSQVALQFKRPYREIGVEKLVHEMLGSGLNEFMHDNLPP